MLTGMLNRVADAAGWWAWRRQVEHTGHCARPVRVHGSTQAVDTRTGEVLADYSSQGEPDGVLLVACKDRRSAVCPTCAETYRRDTWHVIAAGLRGRTPTDLPGAIDAVPASVGTHPVLLATFTAPSFGRVHRASGGDACRPRSDRSRRPVCAHGVGQWCEARHGEGDRRVGQPLCWDCYDYTGHILWHGAAPELWRRTIIYAYRALARLGTEKTGEHITATSVRRLVRVSYIKVAEYQRRGAVHLHAIIRLDGIDPDDPAAVVAPPAWADALTLERALRDAVSRVSVPLPEVGSRLRSAAWGTQLDCAPVSDPLRAATYLAKYATKTAGDVLAGLPPRRFGQAEVARVRRRGVSPHVMLLVAACLRLARHPDCTGFRFAEYPHTLGFRGHFATKSRHYSITLGVLRAVRQAWRSQQSRAPRAGRDPWAIAGESVDGSTVIVSDWRYFGSGWAHPGDAELAATLARDHHAARDAADIATVRNTGGGQ